MDIEELTNAINMAPYSAGPYLDRGVEYFNQKIYNKAKDDFEKALELDPLSSIAYYDRALCYYHGEKNYQMALNDLNKSIELNDKDEHAFELRGRVYIHYEKYDDAIADFTRAIEISPNYFDVYVNRALAYIKGFELYKLAIEDYNHALKLSPDNGMIYMNRGSAYGEGLKDFDNSLKDFKKALEINPNDGESHLGLGLTYLQIGKYKEACLSWKRALDLGCEAAKKYVESKLYKRYF